MRREKWREIAALVALVCMIYTGCGHGNPVSSEGKGVSIEIRTSEVIDVEKTRTENNPVFDDDTDPVIYENRIPEIGIEIEAKKIRDSGCVIAYSYTQNETVSAEHLLGGEVYYLQMEVGGEWKPVPVSTKEPICWSDVGRIINRGEAVEFEENWTGIYGKLESGSYRIIKSIVVKADVNRTKYHKYYVSCSFTI